MEYKRNTITKRNLKQTAKQNSKPSNSSKSKKRTRANKRSKRVNSINIFRTETWFSEFCSGDRTNFYSKDFSEPSFPRWFKSYSKLYQFYKINFIDFEVYTTASTYTSGYITAGFELSSYDEVADSPEALMSYANSKQCAVYRKMTIRLNGSMLTNTPTFRNTTGSNSFSFNFQLFVDTGNDITLFVKVRYSITLKVPQITRTLTSTVNSTLEKSGELVINNVDYDMFKINTGDRICVDTAGACYIGADRNNLHNVIAEQINLIGGQDTYGTLADVSASYVGQNSPYSTVDLSSITGNRNYYGLANLFIRAAVPIVVALAKDKYSNVMKY